MPILLLIFSFLLLCWATPARADVINAASCSDTDVQAAIDSAVDGDRVLVPAGTCAWDANPVVTIQGKGITLEGAGIGQTVIVDNVATDRVIGLIPASANSVIRVTGFTFDRQGTDKSGNSGTMNISGDDSYASKFRVDNSEFINIGGTAIGVFMQGDERSGVIHNVTFQMSADAGDKAIRVFGDAAVGHTAFARPLELGSENFIFVEDCTFDYSKVEDGSLDAFAGARVVFRFNTVKETTIGNHGADSGGFRGVHSMEIYENDFNDVLSDELPSRTISFRSSVAMVFNNTASSNYKGGVSLTNFRSRPGMDNFDPWGACDGTSIWDENQPGLQGYACLDQVGHTFTDSSGGQNDLNPNYHWGNTLGGSQMGVGVRDEVTRPHIEEDRDFYDEKAAFDGSSGVGIGTIAQRPATCTPLVGFWATDEGEWNSNQAGPDGRFYQCSATDTWTLYYTPFTYPHPLRGPSGPPPDPPTDLEAVVD